MIPVQMIRVTMGHSRELHVPVFVLPFMGGQDGSAPPGGFFVGSEGEFGVVLDGRVPAEQIPRLATDEIRRNLEKLRASLPLGSRHSSPHNYPHS